MFLNNASALATRTPRHMNMHINENATTVLRTKSLASSDSNNLLPTKTPKDMTQQQRRRRALGDISNRKNGLGGTSSKGLSVKKQQQPLTLLKPKVNFATPSNKQKSNTIIKHTPSAQLIHIDPIQENQHATKEPEHDYDLVLGRTTRWSTDDDDDRSPFDYISREELFMVDSLLEEMDAREKQKQREEQQRMEEAFDEKLKEAAGCWDAGLEHVDLDSGCYEEEESLGFVHRVDSWEEEDGSTLFSLLEELNL